MNTIFPVVASTRMADVIHLNYQLIPVVGRFGIDFGFGNKTVGEVCKLHGINVYFFLGIVNSYHNKNYFPTEQLQKFSAKLLVDYLYNTHKFYLETKIPEIERLLNGLIEGESALGSENIQLLKAFFQNYKNELVNHLHAEEEEVFPYVNLLEKALVDNEAKQLAMGKIKSGWVSNFERDHDNLEEKLVDLKNLIIKYLPPVINKSQCQKLLIELFRLEKDMENHSGIEDNVLIPKVLSLEQEILDKSGE